MPEAAALEVIECALAHQFGSQRLPGEVLAAVPAAGRTGHSTTLLLRLPFLPIAPRVPLERVVPGWIEQSDELSPTLLGERRGDPPVLQGSGGIPQAEQERSD